MLGSGGYGYLVYGSLDCGYMVGFKLVRDGFNLSQLIQVMQLGFSVVMGIGFYSILGQNVTKSFDFRVGIGPYFWGRSCQWLVGLIFKW